MSSCVDCLSYEVCRRHILYGVSNGSSDKYLQICGHFKDRNCFIEMPCKITPRIDYSLDALGQNLFEAKREITYTWREGVVCDSKLSAQNKIDSWKAGESPSPYNICPDKD